MTQQEDPQERIYDEIPPKESAEALLQISKWTRLISVIGFTIGAFIVVAMLFGGTQILKTMATAMPAGVGNIYPVLVVVFFIFFFMAAVVLYYLYKASQLLMQGVQQNNEQLLAQAFSYLKNFFIAAVVFAALQLLGNLSSFL